MARQDAISYIKSCRREGFADELIRRELEKSGWPNHEIDLAFVEARVVTPEGSHSFVPQNIGLAQNTGGPKKQESLVMKVSVPMQKGSTPVVSQQPIFVPEAVASKIEREQVPVASVPPVQEHKPSGSFAPDVVSGRQRVPVEGIRLTLNQKQIVARPEEITAGTVKGLEQKPIPQAVPVPIAPVVGATSPMIMNDLQKEASRLAGELLQKEQTSIPSPLGASEKKADSVTIPVRTSSVVDTKSSVLSSTVPVTQVSEIPQKNTESVASSPTQTREDFLPKLSKEPATPLPQKPVQPPAQKLPPPGPPPPTRSFSASGDNLLVDLVKEESGQPFVPQSVFVGDTSGRGHRVKLIASLTVGFLVVAGASASGYWYYATTILPKKILAEGLESLATMQSYAHETEIDIRSRGLPTKVSREIIEPLTPQLAGLFMRAMSLSDDSSIENSTFVSPWHLTIQSKGEVDYSNPQRPLVQNLITSVARGGVTDRTLSFEYRFFDGAYYFSFLTLPSISDLTRLLGLIPVQIPDTVSLEKKWVKIESGGADELYKNYTERLKALDGSEMTEVKIPVSNPLGFFGQKDAERQRKTWQKLALTSCGDSITQETVRKVAITYHCKGSLSKEDFSLLLTSYVGADDSSVPDEVQVAIREEIASLREPEVNIWVSKDTREVVKLMVTAGAASSGVPVVGEMKGISEFTWTIFFSAINKDVSLTAPETSVDVKQVLDKSFDFISEGIKNTRAKKRDTQRINDIAQIKAVLELYADGHQKSFPAALSQLIPEHIVVLPKDPLTGQGYTYKRISAKKYRLSAKFEDATNPALKSDVKPGDLTYEIEVSL